MHFLALPVASSRFWTIAGRAVRVRIACLEALTDRGGDGIGQPPFWLFSVLFPVRVEPYKSRHDQILVLKPGARLKPRLQALSVEKNTWARKPALPVTGACSTVFARQRWVNRCCRVMLWPRRCRFPRRSTIKTAINISR